MPIPNYQKGQVFKCDNRERTTSRMNQMDLYGKKLCKHLDEGFCYYQINKRVKHGTIGKCIEKGCKLKE